MSIQEKSTSDRKKEHIELASKSQMSEWTNDKRFYYEPLLKAHPQKLEHPVDFFPKPMKFPLWVSSMTGGTAMAKEINVNLAKACKEFGLGMGLGSCRILLDEPDKHLHDFAVREFIGPDQALYANLGVAQLEKISKEGRWEAVEQMISLLEADGLIVHVNPLQEYLQPEGDRFTMSPLAIVNEVLKNINKPLIVKEVGQGFGPESLKELMKLPVIIEFGAYGGTNFSQLEINRSENGKEDIHGGLSYLGHTAEEMIGYVNDILKEGFDNKSLGFIVSGGVKTYLDGYYAIKKLGAPSVYGQASALLKKAMVSEKELFEFVEEQISGFNLASNYLTIR